MPISGEYCKMKLRQRKSTGFAIRQGQVQIRTLQITVVRWVNPGMFPIASFLIYIVSLRKLTSRHRRFHGE